MKILVDMNLSAKWADFLKENGIKAAHWSLLGSPGASDAEIFAYAKTNDFTVFTNDLDFGFILAITHGKKPSVIQTRTGVQRTDKIGGLVVNAIKMLAADIENGALVTIDQSKTRVTLLPL